jgi:nitroreductase
MDGHVTRTADIDRLLAGRRSIRGFRPDPVHQSEIAAILTAARHAPSGANLQPGAFHALAGPALGRLKDALAAAIAAGRPTVSEYGYFPDPLPPALKAKRRAAGYALYAALGIERRDVAGRRLQFEKNYRFFDAPVGLVVTIRRDMGPGCYMDLGMSLMALMLAAEDRGLSTCGIGALAAYGDVVHETLALDPEVLVVCGMAVGHADMDHPANATRTARDPLESYATFHGFWDE